MGSCHSQSDLIWDIEVEFHECCQWLHILSQKDKTKACSVVWVFRRAIQEQCPLAAVMAMIALYQVYPPNPWTQEKLQRLVEMRRRVRPDPHFRIGKDSIRIVDRVFQTL